MHVKLPVLRNRGPRSPGRPRVYHQRLLEPYDANNLAVLALLQSPATAHVLMVMTWLILHQPSVGQNLHDAPSAE